MQPETPAPVPRVTLATTLATALATMLATLGCSDGQPVARGVDDPTDVVLAARYAVTVEVLPTPGGCLVGGLTASGVDAEAQVEQRGAAVTWVQATPDASGDDDWRLTGHVCGEPDDPRLRLRGGRTAAVTTGNDYCLVDLALPADHGRLPDGLDRCQDPDAGVVELTRDACGRWTADFALGLRFLGDGCPGQPACRLSMRWVATPLDDVEAAEGGGAECGADAGSSADIGSYADADPSPDAGPSPDAETNTP